MRSFFYERIFGLFIKFLAEFAEIMESDEEKDKFRDDANNGNGDQRKLAQEK